MKIGFISTSCYTLCKLREKIFASGRPNVRCDTPVCNHLLWTMHIQTRFYWLHIMQRRLCVSHSAKRTRNFSVFLLTPAPLPNRWLAPLLVLPGLVCFTAPPVTTSWPHETHDGATFEETNSWDGSKVQGFPNYYVSRQRLAEKQTKLLFSCVVSWCSFQLRKRRKGTSQVQTRTICPRKHAMSLLVVQWCLIWTVNVL